VNGKKELGRIAKQMKIYLRKFKIQLLLEEKKSEVKTVWILHIYRNAERFVKL
jgi:hypothetical protein